MLFARQLQASSSGQTDLPRLADGGGDPGGSQRVFQSGQGLSLVAHAHLDQLRGGEV